MYLGLCIWVVFNCIWAFAGNKGKCTDFNVKNNGELGELANKNGKVRKNIQLRLIDIVDFSCQA